ncbi:Stk1 family PASTA domain-containing Ser/Thr kinase [Thermoflavimicrobium daqui]
MEGKKLGDRYEVISRIGGGGMAVVYKARDLLLNRMVAIKILSESLSNDSEFIRRFSREAQAAGSLSHPNVVNVYDVGREDFIHYIVMELIEGPTLKQYILDQGPLSVEESARIAMQICDGLGHAHDNQIVHRDIKPHNIMLHKHGQAKVTDFGIARAASSSTITQQGSMMGSVHYFSPEQARGGQIEERSDIYSLGVVLYEMLTGRLPFDGDTAVSIALKHLQEDPEDPRKFNPSIPDHVVSIVSRAMQKDPNMRYPSIHAMRQDLEQALQFMSNHTYSSPQHYQNKPPFQQFERMNKSEKPKPYVKPDPPRRENKSFVGKIVVQFKEGSSKTLKLLFGFVAICAIIFLAINWFDEDSSTTGGTASASESVQIPDLKNMKKDKAIEELQKLGLEVEEKEEKSDKVKANRVVKTEPESGAEVEKGTTITLYVTPEGKKVEKNYVGLWETRLDKSEVKHWYCNGGQEGKVYHQYPKQGDYLNEGEKVQVWIGSGNSQCQKPPITSDN